MKILLVEDNPAEVDLFYENMEHSTEEACDVVHVSRIEEALNAMDKADYDLVVVDLSLPDSQGKESYQRIQVKDPNMPIIIQTNLQNEKLLEEALKSGVQDYIVKDFMSPYFLGRSISHAIQRNKARQQLISVNDDLQKMNHLKSKFISTVSHELRTPVTILLQTLENFLDGEFGKVSSTQMEWLINMKSNTERLHELIADLLNFSRLQSGREESSREQVDVKKCFSRVIENFRSLTETEKKGIHLTVDSDVPAIWVNRKQIEQLITNLLANGIRYTPLGKNIKLAVRRANESVLIEVSDQGPGLKPELLETVFDPFVQAGEEKESKGNPTGVGLGLAICKEIVVMHKGRIWAENKKSGGARFMVKLPIDLRTKNETTSAPLGAGLMGGVR